MKNYYLFMSCLIIVHCTKIGNDIPKDVSFKEKTIQDFSILTDYVIYSDCATLPTLFIGLHMLMHNKPSFFYMGRANTLDLTKIPENIQSIANDEEMKDKISEINSRNPKATFTFVVNNLRSAKLLSHFYAQNISKNRVKMILIDDGTATYLQFNDYLHNAMSIWNKNRHIYKNHRMKSFNNPEYRSLDKDDFYSSVMFVPSVIDANSSMWLLHPELLVTEDQDFKLFFERNNKRYNKISLYSSYQQLSIDNKNKFIELVGLNKKWALNEGGGTLNNQTIKEAFELSPKPNIIITGTNPYNPKGSDTDVWISKVKEKYGDGYDYFFKGHPGDLSHPADKSIVVLPFRLPIEAIIFSYGNLIAIIGGYESSLYMTTQKNTKKFFFNESTDGSSLTPPLNQMYKQSLLGDVDFFN